MSLAPGVHLGAYEIVSAIGAGGMGEVYRARDPRLGRDVAIKVLPSVFAGDPDRLRRFEQEARAAAALNSPNILTVYDIGTTSTGTGETGPYIVSELLEGETLAERLNSSQPLPVRKAADYAIQIARGLSAAHEKGIVHRDLKPANVFVTTDGRAKILDFGLAKLTEPEPAISGSSMVPTVAPDTLPGVVLGTVGYMSPEQVRGKAADHRSDIFAFGAILYEMLSGQRAFRGETTADTMTAILKEDPPDLPSAERHIPPALGRIVDRCLEKNPAGRFQSASDLGFALEALSSHSGPAEALPGATAALKRRGQLGWIVAAVTSAALVAALAVAGFFYLSPRTPEEVKTMRLSIPLPEGWQLSLAGRVGNTPSPTSLVISPDGRRLAMVANRGDGRDTILIRTLDSPTAQPLAGTEGVSSLFWSPDSRFLGFVADNKLKKIDVTGGPPTTLCDVQGSGGGTWGRDGTIVFATFAPDQARFVLKKVSAAGGTSSDAAPVGSGETRFRPSFLPDGRHFLYAAFPAGPRGPSAPAPIWAGSLDSADRVKLLDSGSTNVQYAQGHLLFLRDGTLMAQPFDVERLKIIGDLVPVAEQIQRQGERPPYGVFSASVDGVLVYQTGSFAAGGSQLAWVDRGGRTLSHIGDRAAYDGLSLSPDGNRAAVVVGTSDVDLWIVDLARGVRARFTFDPVPELFPVWSPDGSRIAFGSRRKTAWPNLYQKLSNGAGVEELLLAGDVPKIPADWSPDGRFLLYATRGTGPANAADLWILPLFGDKKPFPFLATPFNEFRAKFSPDGRWIAYGSDESGRSEVYVAPFSGTAKAGSAATGIGATGGKWQVSSGGGADPKWRRDGKEIVYISLSTGTMMAASVNGQRSAFEVGAVEPLVGTRPSFTPGQAGSLYDVAPDGQRFLTLLTEDVRSDAPPQPVSVVLNWTAAIKK